MSNKTKRLYCEIQHIWMYLKRMWTHGTIVQTTDLILWIVPGTRLRSLSFVVVYFFFLFLACWFILFSITVLLLSLKFLSPLGEISVSKYQDAYLELSFALHCASLLRCCFFFSWHVVTCSLTDIPEFCGKCGRSANAVMHLWLSFVLTVTTMFSCSRTVQYAVWLYTLYFTLPVGSITIFYQVNIYSCYNPLF